MPDLSKRIQIADRIIAKGEPVLIMAEMANAHKGRISRPLCICCLCPQRKFLAFIAKVIFEGKSLSFS